MTTSMLTKRFLHLTQFITGGPGSGCFYGPFLNDTKTTGSVLLWSYVVVLLHRDITRGLAAGESSYRDNQP